MFLIYDIPKSDGVAHMDDAENILSHHFPENHEMIVRHSTNECDLDEMREHFEELALLLQRNVGSDPPNRMTNIVAIARTLDSLRQEICEHLTKCN
jgi:hypothetical protein